MSGRELIGSNEWLRSAAFVADSFLTGTAVLQERLWIGLLFSLLIWAISFLGRRVRCAGDIMMLSTACVRLVECSLFWVRCGLLRRESELASS